MKLNGHDTVQMLLMRWHGRMCGQNHWAAGKNRIWTSFNRACGISERVAKWAIRD